MFDELQVLGDVVTGPLAAPALLAGLIAAVIVVLSFGRVAPAPALALAVGVAALWLGEVGWVVVAGVAGVALRDHLQENSGGAPRGAGTFAGVAGGGAVAVALYPPRLEVLVAVLAALVLPGLLTSDDASTAVGSRVDGVLLLVTLFGIFATVPDTNLAIVTVAATVSIAVLPRVRVGGAASLAIVSVIAASGGWPRPASLIGALGCLGVLVLPTEHGPWWARLVVHAAMVYVAARVAGLGTDVLFAGVLVAAGFVLAAVILPRVPSRGPRAAH